MSRFDQPLIFERKGRKRRETAAKSCQENRLPLRWHTFHENAEEKATDHIDKERAPRKRRVLRQSGDSVTTKRAEAARRKDRREEK